MSEELKPLPLPGLCMDVGTGFRKWYSGDQMYAYARENRRAQPAPSITERQSKWGQLYTAANALIVAIGFHGRLDTDSPEVESLQDKLHDLDSGEWMPGLMPAQSEPSAPADAAPSVAPEPVAWEGGEGWESLAWELCADENGEDACNELIWEGGPIPEPWGDRWMKYEGEAKRLIALVHKHAAHPPRAPLTRELIEECRNALAEELAAWDIDPPLHHVKQAHDKCVAWLAAAPSAKDST